MVGSYAVAGMFMVELRFYTRHAETVFTVARAVSKTWSNNNVNDNRIDLIL